MFKFILVAGVLGLSAVANATQMDKDGILRDENGAMLTITQVEAQTACPSGTHLPTVREFAKASAALGAKGITEVGTDGPPPGYMTVVSLEADGNQDAFYFNAEGYVTPKGDLGTTLFWSASIVNQQYGFVFDGKFGNLHDFIGRDFYQSVRCIQ